MSSELPPTVNVRIETGTPGSARLTIHVTPEYADELAELLDEVADSVDTDIIEHSVVEIVQTVMEVSGPVAVAGATLAKVLKEWSHRHDGKKFAATFNGESISLEGMSPEEMGDLIDEQHARWDARWREQLPGRFPPDGDGDRPAKP